MEGNKQIANPEGKSYQFYIELIFVLLITGIACAAGFSNLLTASKDMYPAAADVMGHMAKVQYIVRCLQDGLAPSWFPYWYNGTHLTQYYPPLSYYLMVPVYALVKNIMVAFKINCFLMMFAGGMGIWYFCRRLIGKWCGLIATIFYCLQPFLLISLYGAGVLAQGPVYAITPWFLYLIIGLCKKPGRLKAALCTVAASLLILSHAMHAFIIVFCIMLVLLLFVMFKKISFTNYAITAATIVFSALLTAFWSVIGVTGLENPTVPYILPGVADNVTADIGWFLPQSAGGFYFALPVLILSAAAALPLMLRLSNKQGSSEERFEIAFCIALNFFTLVFSFGKKIPGFSLIPMSESLVPGRILTLTAATSAIACGYLLFEMIKLSRSIRALPGFLLAVFAISAVVMTIKHLNPFRLNFPVASYEQYEKRFETVKDLPQDPFDKGRYIWFGEYGSAEANIPIKYGFNLSEGWNMEGTVQNRTLWNHLYCIATGTYDYMAKNFAFWNVRYITVLPQYNQIMLPLKEQLGFQPAYGNEFYVSRKPSSYFLTDKRNAMILGVGAPGVAMEFPYLVHEQREDISDYSPEELLKYKLVYLCEPVVDTLGQKEKIEEAVEFLVNNGVTVVIEPTVTKGHKLFDVGVSDVLFENSPVLKKQPLSRIESTVENIKLDDGFAYARVLFGLDKAYYKLEQNYGQLQNDVIGTKKVGDGEVLFVGLHLSQYLKAVYARNLGVPENEAGYPECSDEVKTLFGDLFKTFGVEQDFLPEPFQVQSARWDYKGVDFDYISQEAREVTLSITYTPRWKATLDGQHIKTGQRENLVTLNLPAGEHHVRLVWSDKYGVIGRIISLAGLTFFVVFLIKFDKYIRYFKISGVKIKKSLHL